MDDPHAPRSDQELIAASLARDTAAFGELVTRYQNRLHHSLVHVVGSAEDAKDVAQETFVLAFQKLSTFRGDAQFYTWLYRIALNASVTFRRKNRSLGASLDAAKERIGSEPSDARADSQPEQPIEQAERQHLVRQALSQMTDEFRLPLVLAEMDGLKYEQIAELLKCPIGTVRSRIHRGRAELRDKLRRLLRHEEVLRESDE
ncbi:MAG TPA: sigma-70 family RNA polymerase sigma factor [Planctomycetaceae bacterium]|nr:sigma-70 family RNA polymerase sigma factor [Planctomycetaceae bacterium]